MQHARWHPHPTFPSATCSLCICGVARCVFRVSDLDSCRDGKSLREQGRLHLRGHTTIRRRGTAFRTVDAARKRVRGAGEKRQIHDGQRYTRQTETD
jgi:hypothetical protein